MLDMLGGGVFGTIFGGLFRLAPEILKHFDKKNERAHELAMFDRQCQLESQRGAQRLSEIGAARDMAVDVGAMGVFEAAIKQQADMVKVAGKGWIASLSASVRPVLTYYLLMMYGVAKAVYTWHAYSHGLPTMQILDLVWGPEDMALLTGVINYWMIDRSLAKRGL